jgi:hypothetical protein
LTLGITERRMMLRGFDGNEDEVSEIGAPSKKAQADR